MVRFFFAILIGYYTGKFFLVDLASIHPNDRKMKISFKN